MIGFAGLVVYAGGLLAQNVGIGQAHPQAKLHIAGDLRVDGDSITGDLDKPATILHVLANGGVSIKLDANDDGNERFTVKRSGPDLGSVVFEATEAGNVSASGFGDFNGYGRFDGNLTLDGDSRDLHVGENFDIQAEGSVEFLIDTDGDNASADFGVRNGAGDWMLLLEEDRALTAYPYGNASGESGAMRLRELAAGGSNWVGLRAPDALGSNVWLTLPPNDGSAGQFLQTDGNGVLSWATPGSMLDGAEGGHGTGPVLRALASASDSTSAPASASDLSSASTPASVVPFSWGGSYAWTAHDSSSIWLEAAAFCYLEGVERQDAVLPAAGGCRLVAPAAMGAGTRAGATGPSAGRWRLTGHCSGGCRNQRCAVACR